MFSQWTVALVANLLDDCDKFGLAETCRVLLRLVRPNCSLDQILFDKTRGRSERLSRGGWKFSKLKGALEHCVQFSDAQRAAVTHFYSREAVTDPRFCHFPNLTSLEGRQETQSLTANLSQLRKLASVRVFCRGKQSRRQKLALPASLTELEVYGAAPDAVSSTLKKLSVLDTRISTDDGHLGCSFPALHSVHFLKVRGVEHILRRLPDGLTSLTLTLARPATFRDLLRFRWLRILSLETELVDQSFATFVEQLPETLVSIELINTSPVRSTGLRFQAFRQMQDLRILLLTDVGGFLDLDELRNCKLLCRLRLQGMDVVIHPAEDTQTIWPFLQRSNFEVTTTRL